jgi:hypothetical protein
MARILTLLMLIGFFGALLSASPASAGSCSERKKVCFGYCQKSRGAMPQCFSVCEGYLRECLSSGCWESKIVAKQCGFSRN